MYERIITHDDFDGIVSAAVCSHVFQIGNFQFAGPRAIAESRITITDKDIVCDLPYPLECGIWFDHHEGNAEELKYRGIQIEEIKGYFAIKPSCSRVVHDYFSEKQNLPDHFIKLIEEADIIDSFDYESVEEWRKVTPGKIIEKTLKLRGVTPHDRRHYMTNIVNMLRDSTLEQAAQNSQVKQLYQKYLGEEEQMIEQIRSDINFLPDDREQELLILDLTKHNRRPNVVKNLAYLLFPEASAVIEVKNLFRRDTKTNDLSLSMSLSLNLNRIDHKKDVGEIMRILNIGDGHKGAGAGTISCKSKPEMLKKKEEIMKQIHQIWRNQ